MASIASGMGDLAVLSDRTVSPAIGHADGLIQALNIRGGVVCLVGAGGKKSAMYHIAEHFPGRVGLTTTTHMSHFRADRVDRIIVADPYSLKQQVRSAASARVIGFACATDKPGRNAGIDIEDIEWFHRHSGVDLCLIKADGARGRFIKAPAEHEPVLPQRFETLIPVVSAQAIDKPLHSIFAHRPDEITRITGIAMGEILDAKAVARLLTATDGLMKGAGTATVIPLINMVDNETLLLLARQVAELALQATDRFDRVVLSSFRRSGLVEIIEKKPSGNTIARRS